METLTLILIVVGIFLVIVLSFVAFTIWKFFRKRDKEDETDSMRAPSLKDLDSMQTFSGSFEVPMSYRQVKTQFSEYDGEEVEPKDYRYPRRTSKTPNQLSVGLRRKPAYGSPSRRQSDDITSLLPANIYKESVTPSRFDKTQRRISEGAIEHLTKQGRRVSAADLRHVSLTEEMFINTLDGRSLTSNLTQVDESDNESTSSYTETYDSTTIGMKRRIGEKRKLSGAGMGNTKRTYKKAGKITFTTKYLEVENALEVHLIRITELAPKRDSAEINPFVRIYLLPGKTQKQKTKYQKGTKEPFINERFLFTDLGTQDLDKYRLKIKILNHGKLKQHELLGEVDVALSSLDTSCKETFNVDLVKKRSESSLASVCLSICHQATFSKLEVIVKEAKNLPKIGVSGSPNPYISVSLFREQSIERKDTAKKTNTRDPEYNESIEFDISTDVTKPLTTYTLVVTMNHSSLIGTDCVLGHVIFSLTSPQRSACEQWKYVEQSPHQHDTKWHSLIDPDEL